jgi:hypothetical protein
MKTDPSQQTVIFQALASEIGALIDADPIAAVERARNLSSPGIDQRNLDTLAAGTLVDAGFAVKDLGAVSDGVAILERLLAEWPENYSAEYNLANGLMARANLMWDGDLRWL